jgi:hypothetical protein
LLLGRFASTSLGGNVCARFLEGQLGMAVSRFGLRERRPHLLHRPFGFLSGLAFSGECVLCERQAVHRRAKIARAAMLDRDHLARPAECRTCYLKSERAAHSGFGFRLLLQVSRDFAGGDWFNAVQHT